MPLVQPGVEQTLSVGSEGPRRRPALDCLSAKFEEPDVDLTLKCRVLTSGTFRITSHPLQHKLHLQILLRSVVVQTHMPVHVVSSAEAPRRGSSLRLD